jgi:hypothetical protein
MRNRNFNGVFFIIVEPVSNDVGKQLVKGQIGFKYAFWGQSDGFPEPFQMLAQGIQLG